MHDLVIRDVLCEPTDVVWENLGLEEWRPLRKLGGFLAIVVSFVTMIVVVFVPLASYTINYVQKAGSTPTGVMMTLLGILVMWANWILCLIHIRVSSWVGFARRDREGLFIFKAFAALCLVSFLFNVAMTIFPESSQKAGNDPLKFLFKPLGSGKVVMSMQDLSFEGRAAVHLFHVLVPGSLFIGYLIFPLQGFVWPLVSTLTCLRCMHRRSFGKMLTARQAERALEPLGLSIGHDYMGHVVQPISCSLPLFFASGVTWQTFGFLALWSIFMMPFMRYIHLRSVKRCYFTTNRIDTEVLFAWGAPLSMVLAASCFWAARVHGWPLHVVPLAWLAANALYAFLLFMWIRPLTFAKDEGHACYRASYDEVRSWRFYDWHNCNPIKVLLSHCLDGAEPITPFETGKEYLLVNDPRWQQRMNKVRAARESIDPMMAGSWNFTWLSPSMHVPEVETLIQRPLDAINAIGTHFRPPRPSPGQPPSSRAATQPEGVARRDAAGAGRGDAWQDASSATPPAPTRLDEDIPAKLGELSPASAPARMTGPGVELQPWASGVATGAPPSRDAALE